MPSEHAINLLRAIDRDAAKLGASSSGLERGFAALGFSILEVAEMHYWEVHYDTFREFLNAVAPKCGRSVDQLRRYFLTVRDLSDLFSRDQLETIGITKAMQLRQVKDYAIVLPPRVVLAALSPEATAKDLRKVIHDELKFPEDDQEGEWVDYEAEGYVDAERKAIIDMGIYAAMHTEPVIQVNISKSAQMMEVLWRFAAEYASSHPEALPEVKP